MKIWGHVPAHRGKSNNHGVPQSCSTFKTKPNNNNNNSNNKNSTWLMTLPYAPMRLVSETLKMLCAAPNRLCSRPEHLCEPMSTCCVSCLTQRPSVRHKFDILLTFARMAEHLLNALPCAAAISTSIDSLLVVTLMIDVRPDRLGRYLNS